VVQQDAARFLCCRNWNLVANDNNIVEAEDGGGQLPICAVAPFDGWMDVWMYGWMDGCTGGCMHGWVDGWIN
jgi:hypothetical protein